MLLERFHSIHTHIQLPHKQKQKHFPSGLPSCGTFVALHVFVPSNSRIKTLIFWVFFDTTVTITHPDLTLRYIASHLSAASNISLNSLLKPSLSVQWRAVLWLGMQLSRIFFVEQILDFSFLRGTPHPLSIVCRLLKDTKSLC